MELKVAGNERQTEPMAENWGKVGKISEITGRLRKKEDNLVFREKNRSDSREIQGCDL